MEIQLNPIDKSKLALTNTYTDGINGTIKEVVPQLDVLRPRVYFGEVIANVPNLGQMTIGFIIEGATDLDSACDGFVTAGKKGIAQAIEEHKSERLRQNILGVNQSKLKS
jgi:hypothetical protein